jgi:tetratricopeptide (TPR) repeat protein
MLMVVWRGHWLFRSPARLKTRAEAATRAGDWTTALQAWRAFNATELAQAVTHLNEARACLALGLAAQAEHSLLNASASDPTDPEPWRILLQIYQVEDRTLDAQILGWHAYNHVRSSGRRELLRELTLALLADVSDERVRHILQHWINADPTDIDAQVALIQRIAAQRRAADPGRPTIIATLYAITADHPDHIGAREALVIALADAGEPQLGRTVLDAWPQGARDARYWRLRGRWDLEYEHQYEHAAIALRSTLSILPQDWRSWFRLARTLHILGRNSESHQAAETVTRIRELLDPLSLGPRLDAAFNHINEPAALRDLASLCQRAGLIQLADAWQLESVSQLHPSDALSP